MKTSFTFVRIKIFLLTILCFTIYITTNAQSPSFKEETPEWLPQSYTTYHWLSSDPGKWIADYEFRIHYNTDGRIKSQYQIKADSGDTLFRVRYSYISIDQQLSSTTTTTHQYSGDGIWIPVSMNIKHININNDIVENAHYTWTNATAWIQQNGFRYDYIYEGSRIIRSVVQEYSSEQSRYNNFEREVFYYDKEKLTTWLMQQWDSERQYWKHKERIDATFHTTETPEMLTYSSFIDSSWVKMSAKANILWHSYVNFVDDYEYLEFNLLYPFNNQLQVFYRYEYEYLGNNSSIKTGFQLIDDEWSYLTRLSQIIDSQGNLLEIHNEKWDQTWTTTYRINTHYTYDGEKLIEHYTKQLDTDYMVWNNVNRVVYSDHSMTSLPVVTEDIEVHIYPVPVRDKLGIEFPLSSINIINAEIFTITGRQVQCYCGITPESEINVEGLLPGMYILVVRFDSPSLHIASYKFMKL